MSHERPGYLTSRSHRPAQTRAHRCLKEVDLNKNISRSGETVKTALTKGLKQKSEIPRNIIVT